MTAILEKIRLTEFSHGGGCGCKIAPAVLSELLASTPIRGLPKELMVGTETADDAAVYKLNDTQALVATTDFFTPIVDDPYDFGRIAATNAISDIYAMGATPIFALAVVGMPLEKIPLEVIGRILAGGDSVCAEAGIPIAGGPSRSTVWSRLASFILKKSREIPLRDPAISWCLASRSASASCRRRSRKESSRQRATRR